jgi:ribonuclease G
MQKILLNVESKEIRYAYLKVGQLQDLIIERKKSRQITGNVYRGRVTNILHNIQSAFIDINENENGFIHISDILENKKKFEEMFDMDFELGFEPRKIPQKGKSEKDINQILKIDQPVLVQVVKEPIGNKGARLTSNISIAGRYLVLLPNTPHRGVSRKIEDRAQRDRLKKIIKAFEMPQDMGLICRTSSINVTPEILINEATELLRSWQTIVDKFHLAEGPECIYQESDLIKKAVLTAVNKKYDQILVDDYITYQKCKKIYEKYKEEHPLKIELYRDKTPMFERFNVEKEIDKALRRKVWLGSGGYLFFDKTEAMYTIDVNSGRSNTPSDNKSNVEESLVRINLEAAEEIARQLRLRNVGGLVICDFIDMRLRKNQRRILEKLKECMKEDFAKCTILGMSDFGLVEMTRQRSRESLFQTMFMSCPYCHGNGKIKNAESVSVEIERTLKKLFFSKNELDLHLVVHPVIYDHLQKNDIDFFQKMSNKANGRLEVSNKDTLHLNEYEFYSLNNGQKIDT